MTSSRASCSATDVARFTGALDSFPGVIRAAERGTLFLDEIGDLDPAVQPKLLRFLESAEVHPVGEAKPSPSRCASSRRPTRNLDALVEQGRFRQDLFYWIGVAKLAMPRCAILQKDEIPALASLFLERYSRECQRRHIHLADDFIAALLLYDWPGNIRQLANEIRRVNAMAADGDTHAVRRCHRRSRACGTRGRRRSTRARRRCQSDSIRASIRAMAELERRFIEHAAMAAAGGLSR